MEWNVVIKQSEIVESNVRIGCFNLSVHHYIKCGDTWFASCYGIFDKIELYETENPVVQIKTSQSMRHYTKSDRVAQHSIPFWGSGAKFRDKFYNIGHIH